MLVIGVGWSLYDSLIKDEPTDTLHNSQLAACQRGVTRSELDQRFALEAAEARRRNAEKLAREGNSVGAQNEIATATEYENIAAGYARLTPKDCNVAYPAP